MISIVDDGGATLRTELASGGPSYVVANRRLKPRRSRRGSTSCTK